MIICYWVHRFFIILHYDTACFIASKSAIPTLNLILDFQACPSGRCSAELLCGFKTFYMDGAPFRPTSKRVQGDMVLMKLPEVDDMDAAAALKRKVLSIRRNDVQLKPGEHFDAEIIGMNVYNYFPHTYIGTVVDVLSYPAHKLYKVKGEEKTYLIPAVKDIFITDIDEEAREISVHMIEGLETDED